MKTLILVVFCSVALIGHAQHFEIHPSSPKTIDGIMEKGEWNLDRFFTIDNPDGTNTKIYLAHDGSNLYVAFQGTMEQRRTFYPEVLIDVNGEGGSDWNTDDWWFQVSAKDCANRGAYEIYNDCEQDHDDWHAFPNIDDPATPINLVEISISFEKLGWIGQIDFDCKMAFLLTDGFSSWEVWPETSSPLHPASWQDFRIVSPISTGVSNNDAVPFEIYPNPAQDFLQLRSENEDYTWNIFDSKGSLVLNSTDRGDNSISISRLDAGIYYLKVDLNNHNLGFPFIKK